MSRFALALVFGCVASVTALAAEPLKKKEWKVGEATREALVYAPAKATQEPCPLVFVFHGHGGTMKNASPQKAVHHHWPEGSCVLPPGVNTPRQLTHTPSEKNGGESNTT